MSFEKQPDLIDQVNSWPLLTRLGPRTLFYHQGQALELNRSISSNPEFALQLQELEDLLYRGRKIPNPADLFTPPTLDAELNIVLQNAAKAGGLRFHSLHDDLPLTDPAILLPEPSSYFSVLHMNKAQSLTHECEETVSNSKRRVLVYYNPAGEPLPVAEAEALEISRLFEKQADVNFISYSLEQSILEKLYNESEIIFYLGHGKLIADHPVIPGPKDKEWLPFPANRLNGPKNHEKALFFLACLPGVQAGAVFHSGFTMFPRCNLADRRSDFIQDICESWLSGVNLYCALRDASKKDIQKGDIRRLVFQIHGSNYISSNINIF